MRDTTPEAQAVQDEVMRRMTGEQRLKLAFEMSEMARGLAMARLRAEHPDWSDWLLKRELLRYAFGSEPWPPPLYWPEPHPPQDPPHGSGSPSST